MEVYIITTITRNYEFIPVKKKIDSNNYENQYFNALSEVQKKLDGLTLSQSYSVKIVQSSGNVDLDTGFFYDKSTEKRPNSLPSGPRWIALRFEFKDTNTRAQALKELIDGLNDPKTMQTKANMLLSDAQIYYSQIGFDLYGQKGNYTLWYKSE